MTKESLEQKHAAIAALLAEETLIAYRKIIAARFPYLATAKNTAARIDECLEDLRKESPDSWETKLRQMDMESKNPILPSNRE
ncbi:MAG: hypothetical protein WC862_03070 [Patescibacteria group bacterium]